MPTATGSKIAPTQVKVIPAQTGFTLIEILVVVVIIGILLTTTVALRGGHSDQRTLLAEAERLRSVFFLAQQAAAEQGLPLKLTVTDQGYRFEQFMPDYQADPESVENGAQVSAGLPLYLLVRQPEGRWQPPEASALRDYKPEREFTFQLKLGFDLGQREDDSEKGGGDATELLIPPSGVTAGFTIRFYLVDLPSRVVTLTSDGLSLPDYALSTK